MAGRRASAHPHAGRGRAATCPALRRRNRGTRSLRPESPLQRELPEGLHVNLTVRPAYASRGHARRESDADPQGARGARGQRPRLASSSRTSTRAGRFKRSSVTVTRALGVRGKIMPPLIAKCIGHCSRRGLNREVKVPVSESSEARSVPLQRLQAKQASARFDASVTPPCFCAMI